MDTERALAGPWAPLIVETSTDTDDAAEPLTPDRVVARAVALSPAVEALTHRARASLHAARAEAALPSAELAVELWNAPLTRPYALDEADMVMVELRQRFPAAGARDARARALIEEARAVWAERAEEVRAVATRAALALADLKQAEAEAALIDRQRALLERMREAVRARYTTGAASLADAARLDVELARAGRARARVSGARAAAAEQLRVLLGRGAAAPLPPLAASPVETTTVTAEALVRLAEVRRGAVASAQARLGAATARREGAEAEAARPEVMVGVGYWQQPGERAGVGVSAAITLPWLWGAGAHLAERAREDERAERAGRASGARDARGEVVEAHARLRALEQELRVLRAEGLPTARRAQVALEAAYATGNASLLDWLETARAVLELELERAALCGDVARALAALERAVGVALPRAPLGEDEAP